MISPIWPAKLLVEVAPINIGIDPAVFALALAPPGVPPTPLAYTMVLVVRKDATDVKYGVDDVIVPDDGLNSEPEL
jgi:hypothetical protein